jgi:NCAIR mutase (PurE)-related protein
MNDEIQKMSIEHGSIEYNEKARVISMKASSLNNKRMPESRIKDHVVVATAGTTDLPVAEEAAAILEAAGCKVDRIFDVGVAGLHRVLRALPRLQDDKVGAVIVCAGMDGALPSVVGGLVSVPVFACPTSVGYGVSLGGIAAMLTMLNSCSPGVSVVNVDNGFGAAACAYKAIRRTSLGK